MNLNVPTNTAGRRITELAIVAALCAGLAGCAAGPGYVQPVLNTPQSYQHAPAPTTATGAVARLDQWWNGFHDPLLNVIIERVQINNLDLEIAMARVQQARAAARLGEANLMPRGELGLQAASQRQSLQSPIGTIAHNFPSYERDTTLYDSNVGASWEVDLSGGLHHAGEAALADAQASEAERMAVRVTVEADAADAYFRILGLQQRITLAQGQVKADADLLEVVDLRLNRGLGTRQEQAEAQARLAQVRASLPPLRHELDTQLNRLDILMGAVPGSFASEFSSELNATWREPAVPFLAGKLNPAELLQRRPDVLAAERRLAASHARIGVATAEYYPKLSLSALIGFEGLDTAAMNSATFQPGLLAGLHWRLFDFGRIDAEVAQAKGANAEALIRYRSAMLHATEDVENALSAQAELALERKELKNEVDADWRARMAAEDAYKGGVTGIVELLEQDRQLLASRDQLARVDADSARAAVAAFRALGGGW